jgi:DNA-binding response OmpR family regulator
MAKDAGVHLILSKPFDIDELLMIVRNALGTPMGIVK